MDDEDQGFNEGEDPEVGGISEEEGDLDLF